MGCSIFNSIWPKRASKEVIWREIMGESYGNTEKRYFR